MTNGQLWVLAGGAVAVGGFLWYRSRSQGGALWGAEGVIPMARDYAAPAGVVSYRMAAPVSGPVQDGSRVAIGPSGPSAGQTFGKIGVSAGTAIGTAAIGPGLVSMAALTAGIGAGVAALVWAISSKGLFRGGEVGILVNPARDQFLLQFGPGGTGPDSGFGRLAAALSEITGEPNGSHYFQALIGATSKEQLVTATQDIQGVLASIGVRIGAYEG
jgi:hypothetical protein